MQETPPKKIGERHLVEHLENSGWAEQQRAALRNHLASWVGRSNDPDKTLRAAQKPASLRAERYFLLLASWLISVFNLSSVTLDLFLIAVPHAK